jgi:hypothetical protein
LRIKDVYIRRAPLPYLCRQREIHSYHPRGSGPHASLVFTGRAKTALGYVWKDRDPLSSP